ncbi:MAG: hypothetical protein DIZ80_16875 [endosymbiont of Galathealinum brachiosum]|uniref:Uncharacterized protein n=1 Tax=endosymbiont of Galathealinum brachiosum TaxID=2200906 RepID=A0A370D7U7_9GAMM|nr:MAG: hypothetical protein DIZ80_16875 [endosymbiont of Galathealinum brachiosum]
MLIKTKIQIFTGLIFLSIVSSIYPGLCQLSPFPMVLLGSGPFILYGMIYLLIKRESVLISCIWAISITLFLTLLSQYTIYSNCKGTTYGYSALPYLFVTLSNYMIAGLAFFIALNSYFRNHENKPLNSIASFISASGIIIMVTILVVTLIEILA